MADKLPKMDELDDTASKNCMCELVAYNGSLQMAHWMADTITNQHRALGDLYDKMVGLTDDFAEVYMGKYGLVGFPPDAKITDVTNNPVSKGLEIVEEMQDRFEAGKDDDLLNILADMSSALNKARYLLKEEPDVEEEDEEEKKEPKEKKEKKEVVKPKVIIAISRKFGKK